MATTYLSTDPMAGMPYQPNGQNPLQQWQAKSQQMQAAGMPQLDPSIGSYTPIVGATRYYDNNTHQSIDPSDPRIVAYNQQLQQWGQANPQYAPNMGGGSLSNIQYGGGASPTNLQPGGLNVSAPAGGVTPGSGIVGPNNGPSTAGTAPQVTNPNDPAQIRAWLQWRASQPGSDPILQTPGGIDYYANAIGQNGGLTDQNYWTNKSTLAQYGGAVGAGGGGGMGGGSNPWWFNTLPSADQAANTPGYQFIQKEAMNSVLNNKAAQGLLQSGSTLKDLQDRAGGIAASNYFNLANLGLGYNQANYGNAYNLANLGLNASSIGATGRPV